MLTIPGQCWLCQTSLTLPRWGICSRCTAALPGPPASCSRCGLPALSGNTPCGSCLQHTPIWDAMVYVTSYCPPLNQLIHQLKFNYTPSLAPTLARLLLLKVLETRRKSALPLPDTLISVPLHQRRAWRRGYNQSALLAAPLARWLDCGYLPRAAGRIRATHVQHKLSARRRKQNMKGCFSVEFPLTGRHMAVVDDIVTTGSTVAELAKVLKKQGAATVQVWCLCRTL